MTWTSPDFRTLFWLPTAPTDFAEAINDLKEHPQPGKQLRRLATSRLNSSQLRRLRSAIDEMSRSPESAGALSEFRRIRVGLVGNVTLDYLVDLMPGTAPRHGMLIDTAKGHYDAVAGLMHGMDVGLTGNLDAIVLVLDAKAFHLPGKLLDRENHDVAVKSARDYVEQLVEAVSKQFKCAVVVATIPIDPYSIATITDASLNGSYLRFIQDVNRAIADLAKDGACILWDLDFLASSVGRFEWNDPIARNVAKSPFAISLAPVVSESLCATLAGLFGKSRRGLILDLDNTLWGGVIGDDGLAGIVIGQGDAVGEAHLAVQKYALELRRRGIVLAACSKNEDATAREPFRNHPDMLLREDHLAVFQANWSDKATNIVSIANTLALGLDAFVFLDDNPAERARVRQELPEVAIPELPEDPSWFAPCLAAARYFESPRLNKEDLQRAQSYQDNARRAEIRAKVGNYDDYLRSLQMELIISPFDAVGRGRIAQLISKSNQFNLTTRRYNESEVEQVENDPNTIGLQFRLKDTFGDNGMICVIVLRKLDKVMHVDTWLMSCRVLERGVETAVLNEIVRHAKAVGATKIVGEFIPSKRNDMVREHYKKLGFEKAPVDLFASPGDVWALDLTSYTDGIVHMTINHQGFQADGSPIPVETNA